MKRLLLPLLAVALLLAGSLAAINFVNAAPAAQATATRTPRATAEVTEEATAEATEEADDDATPEATEEADDDATPEATEEADDDATPEATEEADDEATPEATEEADDEADDAADDAAAVDEELVEISDSVFPGFPDTANLDANRTLTVVGTGRVQTPPGAASVTLGIETANSDVTDATSENEEIIQDIIAAIDELGIDRDNIQTSNLSVYLDTGDRGLESGGTATYRVSQQVTVMIRNLQNDPDLLGELISAAVDAGANSVFGPSFQIVETRALQQTARTRAMEDALARAQDYATLAGVELVGVARIVEGELVSPPMPLVAAEQAADDGGGGIGSSIESGTLSYEVSVQVVFYIRDVGAAQEGSDDADDVSESESAESPEGEGADDAGAEGEGEGTPEATPESAEGEGEATPEATPESAEGEGEATPEATPENADG